MSESLCWSNYYSMTFTIVYHMPTGQTDQKDLSGAVYQ